MGKCDNLSSAEKQKALMTFFLDIDCLNELSKYTSGINFFDVLKISKAEIRHSNMLAWLLNPNENHGVGDLFIRGIFQSIIKTSSKPADDKIFKVLLADFNDFTIHREYHNIDLLLVSDAQKIVLCIENKVDSDEHDNQLQRYQDFIGKKFPHDEWTQFFAFLSPDGREASDSDNWIAISYEKIAKLLQHCMKQTSLPNDSKMILEHYLMIIRREIVDDKNLIRICNEIYAKHQKALDLIFENKYDSSNAVYDVILEWCKGKKTEGKICFDENDGNKSYVRFSTENLNVLYPLLESKQSGFHNKHSAFYEINNHDKKIRVACCVSSINLPDELVQRTKSISGSELKENWEWKTIYSVKSIRVEDDNGMLVDDKKIKAYLDDTLKKIRDFEQKHLNVFNLAPAAQIPTEDSIGNQNTHN